MKNLRPVRGFTLIELLVVITIIVVLMAILLPSLARARVQAKRTVCLSNLRSTYLAVKEYGTEYNDVTPLGAWANKQFNYIVYYPPASGGSLARPSAYGLIVSAGYITNGKITYCPVAEDNSVYFNTPTNPWRSYPLPSADPYGNNETRIGYGMRPMANWVPYVQNATPDPNPAMVGNYFPINLWVPNPGSPSVAKTTVDYRDISKGIIQWPKLTDMVHAAILSDITPHYPGLIGRHKEGVNALYGSGAASWVPASAFLKDIVGPGCPSTSVTDPNTGFSPIWNDNMLSDSAIPPTGLWADLDRYH